MYMFGFTFALIGINVWTKRKSSDNCLCGTAETEWPGSMEVICTDNKVIVDEIKKKKKKETRKLLKLLINTGCQYRDMW